MSWWLSYSSHEEKTITIVNINCWGYWYINYFIFYKINPNSYFKNKHHFLSWNFNFGPWTWKSPIFFIKNLVTNLQHISKLILTPKINTLWTFKIWTVTRPWPGGERSLQSIHHQLWWVSYYDHILQKTSSFSDSCRWWGMFPEKNFLFILHLN